MQAITLGSGDGTDGCLDIQGITPKAVDGIDVDGVAFTDVGQEPGELATLFRRDRTAGPLVRELLEACPMTFEPVFGRDWKLAPKLRLLSHGQWMAAGLMPRVRGASLSRTVLSSWPGFARLATRPMT